MKKLIYLLTIVVATMVVFANCQNDEPGRPPVPTGVTAIQEGSSIKISWNNDMAESSYMVYRKPIGNFNLFSDYDYDRGDRMFDVPQGYDYVIDENPIEGNNFYGVSKIHYDFSPANSEISKIVSVNFVPIGGGSRTGLYMGIIGFNDAIYTQNIGLLTNYGSTNNKNQYQSFVNGLSMKAATGLYYAVDNALSNLQKAILPDDLVNVSLVTFTDGLDNFSIELNPNYNTRDAYRDAVRNRINSTQIKNLPINAYSIGVRGNDVVDVDAFNAGLAALASNPNNVHAVANMTEVNNVFKQIANSLVDVNQSQSLKLRVPGGFDDGVKIRFTFDNVSDAANSNSYIEGTFRRSGNSRTLQNVVYTGLSSSSGTTVTGELSGGYVTFTFENMSASSGGNVSTTNVQQWEYITSQSRWQRNSEFGQTGDIDTKTERKSAVVVLVLDCTTSLGTADFQSMKTAANNFINILVGN